jgi:hypothetical protein
MKALRAASVMLAFFRMFFLVAVVYAGFLLAIPSKHSSSAIAQANVAANPEIARLWKAFSGDWKTTESMERGEFFPNGGARSGEAHFRLGDGGRAIIEEGYSNGSAGELHFMIVIWWDKPAHVYRFFTCFNDDQVPCRVRGTARWEGETFVNEYEHTENSKTTEWRDVFSQNTEDSITLVAGTVASDRKFTPVITTKYFRGR